jgi:hypothetical protein
VVNCHSALPLDVANPASGEVASTGFYRLHARACVFRQSIGQDAPRRTRAHDDVIRLHCRSPPWHASLVWDRATIHIAGPAGDVTRQPMRVITAISSGSSAQFSGPRGGMILSDLGAEVIKIER